MSEGRGRGLPPPEPGRFGAAPLNSYMWGFWMGILYWLVAWLKADMAQGSRYFLAALGINSVGWGWFWAVILLLMSINPTSEAVGEYYLFTGRTFVQDRIGFAKAGGQDIGMLAGLVSTSVLVVLFARVVPAFVISWIRIPVLIVTSIVLGKRVARILSRRAFSALFGFSPYSK